DVCACQQGLFHQVLSHVLLGVQILIVCIKCKSSHKCYKMQFSGFFLLIFCFSLLKYTYYYNYRSHISLQVVKLAKSAGVQILISPTVNGLDCVWNRTLLSVPDRDGRFTWSPVAAQLPTPPGGAWRE